MTTLDERIEAAKSLIPELRESEVSCQQVAWSRLDGGNDLNLAANLCSRAADAINDLHCLALDLAAERERLLAVLGRIRPVPERILRGVPVRDLDETLAECDAAIASEPRA